MASLLSSVYHITESTSADIDINFPLSASKFSKLVFDIDKLTKLSNEDATILVSFNDPYSSPINNPNEIIKNTVLDTLVEHTFNYAGNYTIHLISNIHGVLHHVNKHLLLYPSGEDYLYTVPLSGSFLGYYENCSIYIKCFDSQAIIYYKILEDMTDFIIYDKTLPVSFVMDTDYKTIEYYAVLSDGYETKIHSSLFTQLKVWAEPVGGEFEDQVQVQLFSNSPDAIIFYTLDGSDPGNFDVLLATESSEVLEEDGIDLAVETIPQKAVWNQFKWNRAVWN